MQKYMHSFKNIYSENINCSNACFVTGPTKSGKSWFVRYNMRKFESLSMKPLVFHYDLRNAKTLNFQMFLYSFEKMIIDTLCKHNKMRENELITPKKLL